MLQRPTRRTFLAMAGAAAVTPFVSARGSSRVSHRQMTVEQVIETVLSAIPEAPLAGTVDTIKVGDPAAHVTGIATTFLATSDVIQRAHDRGANFIITHEPTFFNHLDETEWLVESDVYAAKRTLAEDLGVAIWRFHDYWHLVEPDGILHGMLRRMGWEDAPVSDRDRIDFPAIVQVEPMTLLELANRFKARLGIARPLRAVGDPSMMVERVGLLLGAYGGRNQMQFLMDAAARGGIDVLVIGEVPEWETNVYVSDARSAGIELALLELGHAESEEPGMEWLVDWLRPKVADIPVMHVPTGDVFVRL